MPRGIYDRSKQKKSAKDSTETVIKTAAPKGKRGRKPGSKNTESKLEPKKVQLGDVQVHKTVDYSNISMMHEIRANLSTLALLKDKFSNVHGIDDEVAAHVTILSRLRTETFGDGEQTTPDEQVETATAPVTASVPATTTTVAPTNSVQLPPVPLPPGLQAQH